MLKKRSFLISRDQSGGVRVTKLLAQKVAKDKEVTDAPPRESKIPSDGLTFIARSRGDELDS